MRRRPTLDPPQWLRLNQSTIHCENYCAELPLEGTDVVKLQPEGAHYQERKVCCPVCSNVLLLEVTMAGAEPSVDMAKALWG